MSTNSSIEWTDATWNPVRGCSLVSDGCRNCYAMKFAHRFSGKGGRYEGLTELGPQGPRWTGKVRLVPEVLNAPLQWKKPRMIFVNSMSDLFHQDVPFDFIDLVFAVMFRAPQHTFQILTKRPGRMLEYVMRSQVLTHAPWDNVWLGVSCENQQTADERIPILVQTPAAVKWVSCEPLLGPVDLQLQGRNFGIESKHEYLDWVVVGGESGHGARPMHPDWARSLRDQCTSAGVPFFFKQWGNWWPLISPYEVGTKESELRSDLIERGVRVHDWPDGMKSVNTGKHAAGRLLDGREWNQYPSVKGITV